MFELLIGKKKKSLLGPPTPFPHLKNGYAIVLYDAIADAGNNNLKTFFAYEVEMYNSYGVNILRETPSQQTVAFF